MTRLAAFGISLGVPTGWEARAFRHDDGEPTLHLASFPLPAADGDFGTEATAAMPDDAIFLSLTEYRVAAADLKRGVFAQRMPARLHANMLSDRTLLRPVRGQRGLQRFFAASRRAFCLYVVVGRHGAHRIGAANDVLASLTVRR